MKRIFAVLAIAALTGCGTLSKSVLTPVATKVPVVQTNTVTVTNQVTQTNVTGLVVTTTNVVTSLVLQTNLVTQTNFIVNPGLTGAIQTAQAVNTLTGPVNPFSGWITLALGAATLGLGALAKIKSAQASTNGSIASTVVQAIENAPPQVAAAAKAAVSDLATKKGIYTTLDDFVQTATK
jgi:hypothetical protein